MKNLASYIILLILLVSISAHAQQEPMYGQYFFNNAAINPAQAGGLGYSQVGALFRSQWVGLEGAPQTITVYGNFILPLNLGLAVGIYQDKFGVETNQHFQTDLSYHLEIFDNWYLSSGLRFIVTNYRADLTQIPNVDPNNPYFMSDYSSGVFVNTGFGFLAYNNNNFIGLSVPKVFTKQIQSTNSGEVDFERDKGFNFFAYGGHNFKLSENFDLIPSTVIRYSNAPLQIDVNAIFRLMDVFDFGPVMRMNFVENNGLIDGLGFLMGVRFLENFYFGYLYEYPVSDLRLATVQTHEISLRYFLNGGKGELIRAPRFFL